jgi:hypothetical protein
MKEVFCISSGEYSDYQVLAVCEDKATAEAWIAALHNDEDGWYRTARLESLPVIVPGAKPEKERQYSQHVELLDDGTIKSGDIRLHCDFPVGGYGSPPPVRPLVRYVRAPCHHGKGGRLEVRASTAEAVAKVVGERIAMWKAGAFGGPRHEEINEEVTA